MFVFLFQDVFLCYDLGVLQWKFREQQLSVHWSTETVFLFLTCGRITAQPWNDDTLKCKTTGEISAPNSGSFIFGGLSLPLLSIQPVCSVKISWLWLLKETTKRIFGLFVCLTPTTETQTQVLSSYSQYSYNPLISMEADATDAVLGAMVWSICRIWTSAAISGLQCG